MDAIKKGASLENICVPILEHVVKSKDHKNRKQATCLFHWLFQHKEVDTALAKSLLLIIRGSQYEKRVKLGWCIAVRDLVQSTLDFEKIHSRVEMGGFPHQALTTIADSVSKLVQIVCNESVQDGKECSPTRLTTMAVDCILVTTRALCELDKSLKTNAHRDDNNLLQRSDFGDLASKSFDAELTWGSRESSQVIDIETSCIRIGLDGLGSHKQISLWSMLDDLIVLISELYKLREEIVRHPLMISIQQLLCSILLWTNVNNSEEVEKTQHGCIDCLAMMIRAELVIATGRGNVLPGMTVQKSTLLIEEMDRSTSEDLKHRVDSDISILYMVLNCFLKCNDKVFSHGASTLSSSQMDLSWTSQYYTAQQKSEGADILLQENKLEVDDWNKYRSLQGLDDNIIDTNNLVLAKEPKSNVHANEQPGVIPMAFRVCMANILISACSKIPPSADQLFSMISIPPITNYAQVAEDSYIRASCLQMLFTSVYHLKSAAAVIEASHDLMRLSLRSLRGRGVPEERINGAKLLAALLANECSLEEIKPHLMDVQVSLMNIAHLDPSAELRALCEKLLNCMSTIN